LPTQTGGTRSSFAPPRGRLPRFDFLKQTIRAVARAGNGMELQTHRNLMGVLPIIAARIAGNRQPGSLPICRRISALNESAANRPSRRRRAALKGGRSER
jgi:hypothetical protein